MKERRVHLVKITNNNTTQRHLFHKEEQAKKFYSDNRSQAILITMNERALGALAQHEAHTFVYH